MREPNRTERISVSLARRFFSRTDRLRRAASSGKPMTCGRETAAAIGQVGGHSMPLFY